MLERLQAPDEGQVGLLSGSFEQPAAQKKVSIRGEVMQSFGTSDLPSRPRLTITDDIAWLD